MNLNPIILETKRLKLTGFSPEEMSFIFENNSKNEIKKILGHRTEEDYLKEEYKYQNGYAAYNRKFLLFLLSEKTSNTIIGRCGLHNWNIEHNRAEIGYNLVDDNFKRKGFMTEAVRAVIDYGFNTLKLHRLEALVGSNNTASLKIIENNFFVKEGLLRQHFYVAEKFEDSIVYSLLRSEYTSRNDDKKTNQ